MTRNAHRPARPAPSSPQVSRRMQLQATRDTQPELAIRRELHRRGLRYRLHRRPIITSNRVADVLFRRAQVAVYVDGCWWHGCPHHKSWAKANELFWRDKIDRNVARDRETDATLRAAGWLVVRVWEHEAAAEAASRIEAVVRRRLAEGMPALVPA